MDDRIDTVIDALIDHLSRVRLRDPLGMSEMYAHAVVLLPVLHMLAQGSLSTNDATFFALIDEHLAELQVNVRALCQQQPYVGHFPEQAALDVAKLLIACESATRQERARVAHVIGPLRDAFVTAMQAPDDDTFARQVGQALEAVAGVNIADMMFPAENEWSR